MSLINDALKRASETRKQSGDAPPPVTLNPVDYAVRPNPAFRLLIVLLLVVALAFTAWFLSKWQENAALAAKLQAATTNAPPAVAAAPTEAPATESRWKIKVSTNLVTRNASSARPTSRPAAVAVQSDPAEGPF